MRAKDFHMKILHWVKDGLEQKVAWFERDFCVTIYKIIFWPTKFGENDHTLRMISWYNIVFVLHLNFFKYISII